MIDFTSVSDVTIPNGKVERIRSLYSGQVLWEKRLDTYITAGLSVLLDYRTVRNGDTVWIDKIQQLPFTLKGIDTSNLVSGKGVIFTASKAVCESPIDFSKGFTVEFCYRDCSSSGLAMVRFGSCSRNNKEFAPNFFYANTGNKGYQIGTWAGLTFGDGNNFMENATIAFSVSENGEGTIYVNGVRTATGTNQAPTSCDCLSLGGWYDLDTPTEVFNGKMAFVRLYDRVLTENEISTNYNIDKATVGGQV